MGNDLRAEAIARVRNEARGIDHEPATISYEEADARARGEVLLPHTDRATSYDEDLAEARGLRARAEAEAARGRRVGIADALEAAKDRQWRDPAEHWAGGRYQQPREQGGRER